MGDDLTTWGGISKSQGQVVLWGDASVGQAGVIIEPETGVEVRVAHQHDAGCCLDGVETIFERVQRISLIELYQKASISWYNFLEFIVIRH
jgi:hypothetical protein